MHLGMSSAAFYGRMDTEDAAGHLADFPIQTCEVFLQTFSEYTPEFGKCVRERLRGLACSSVHPKGTQFELELFASYHRQRMDAFRIFDGVCAAGEAIGASFYVMHGPSGFRNGIDPGKIRNLRTVYPELQKIAFSHGMEILWENVSWCACSHTEHVAMLLDAFPQQRFVLDIKQARQADTDPLDMARAMGEHLAHVHVLDWNEEGSLTLPGEGIFDFPELMRVLKSIHYQGAVILEPYSYQALDEGRLRNSLTYLQNIIAQDLCP